MGSAKQVKIVVDGFGSFLGRDKGCLIVRDRDRNEVRTSFVVMVTYW